MKNTAQINLLCNSQTSRRVYWQQHFLSWHLSDISLYIWGSDRGWEVVDHLAGGTLSIVVWSISLYINMRLAFNYHIFVHISDWGGHRQAQNQQSWWAFQHGWKGAGAEAQRSWRQEGQKSADWRCDGWSGGLNEGMTGYFRSCDRRHLWSFISTIIRVKDPPGPLQVIICWPSLGLAQI